MSSLLPPSGMSFPTKKSHRVWIKRGCDFFLYTTVAIGVIISFKGYFGFYPRNTYIHCYDSSISRDLLGDSIPIHMLLIISLFVPLIMMVVCEWASLAQRSVPCCPPPRPALTRGLSFFWCLFSGCLLSFFVVEILKTTVSEPRPHFMNSCKPNLTEEMCQKQQWIHVTYENCTNPKQLRHSRLIDTMKSFPSGHASISVFSAVFMTIYIQKRVKVSWSKLFVPWLQLLWWIWAFLCCASRVWDNAHHWWDVVAGGLLGGVPGYFTVVYLCNWFEDKVCRSSTISDDEKHLSSNHLRMDCASETGN